MAAPVFVFQGELLHQAAIYDQLDLLKSLLQAGVHGEANSPDPNGLTPLHTAATHDSVQCLKELLVWKGIVFFFRDSIYYQNRYSAFSETCETVAVVEELI